MMMFPTSFVVVVLTMQMVTMNKTPENLQSATVFDVLSLEIVFGAVNMVIHKS